MMLQKYGKFVFKRFLTVKVYRLKIVLKILDLQAK